MSDTMSSRAARQRPSKRARDIFAALSFLAVLALSAWPYWTTLRLSPTSFDAAVWIVNGSVSNPDWWNWVWRGPHFIGYRPVTAATYALNSVWAGLDPTAYRATDLLLHLTVAVLTFALALRLARRLPRWVALFSAAIFALLPLAEDVVPLVARRSYLLVTLFSASAVLTMLPRRGRDWQTRGWAALFAAASASAAFVALAIFSHELGVVTAAIVPLAALYSAVGHRARLSRAAIASLAPCLAAGVAIVARLTLFGGVGGYALTDELQSPSGSFDQIVWATLRHLFCAAPLYGDRAGALGWPSLLALPAAGVYFWHGLVRSGWLWRCRDSRTLLLLTLWTLAFALLNATQGVWHPRQVYPALLPFSLLTALLAGQLLARPRRLPPIHLISVASLALLAGLVFYNSPTVHGTNAIRLACWRGFDECLVQAEESLSSLPAGSHVCAILPISDNVRVASTAGNRTQLGRSFTMRTAGVWLAARLRARGCHVSVECPLFYDGSASPADGTPIEWRGLDDSLRLKPGYAFYRLRNNQVAHFKTTAAHYMALSKFDWPAGRRRFVYAPGMGTIEYVEPQ